MVVGLVGRFANAGEGSVAAFTLNGMQTAASTDAALYTLDIVDLDATDSADPNSAIQMTIGRGASVVVVAGAEYTDATRNAAQSNPNVKFVLVDESNPSGASTLQNLFAVGGAGNRADQSGFLAGALAGYVTQAHIAGVVTVGNTLEGRLYGNGFQQGLRYSCGDCTLWPIELANADDLEAGQGTAARLINVKVDVMAAFAGAAGEAGVAKAAAQGVWVIGSHDDLAQTLPSARERVLASLLYRPDVSLPALVNEVLAGGPVAARPFNLADGTITFSSEFGPDVSPAVIELLASTIDQLASGALDTGVDPLTGKLK
jgi:basic membrane protein A